MRADTTGHKAENVVADYLESRGYNIVDRNWRTRLCEIDIIAQKASTVYFVEVKYRKNSVQGSGLEYITAKKLNQMRFSAEMWLAQNGWTGDSQLMGLQVPGPDFKVDAVVELE